MMNRQIRRAQAKQDRKAERDKEERREARKEKLAQLRRKRAERRAEVRAGPRAGKATTGKRDAVEGDAGAEPSDAKASAKPRGRAAGRFSGALMMATVFFIVLQSSVPPEEAGNEVLRTVTGAGFFLLFGYFSVLWLMRRQTPRPLMMTWITGALLIVGVEVAKAVQGVVPHDPLTVALALPGVVAGSYLGRLVFENSPA